MNNFKKILTIIIIIFSQINITFAQQGQEQKPATGNVSKPIELPNFIIEGKEQLNVKTGTKQAPDKPSVMSKEQLDSLNSLEKQQSQLLPPEPLPLKVINTEYDRGYLNASIGRYLITDFEVGYGFELKDYSFFANAGFDHSNGHISNSDFNRVHINLFSDYIAPDKFFIFGGSKTRTNLKFNNSNYKLYANNFPVERQVMNLNLGLQSDGSYKGFIFSTGAKFHSLQMSNNYPDSISTSLGNNLLSGNLMVKNSGHLYEIGAKAKVDFEFLRTNSAHFFESSAFGTLNLNKLTVNVEAGFQSGSSSNEIVRAGLLLKGDLSYNLNSLFTLKAGIFSGLNKHYFNELVITNPYIDRFANIDYSYDLPAIKAFIYYHPNQEIGISGGIKLGSKDRSPIYDSLNAGSLTLIYEQINYFALESEAFWTLTQIDKLLANISFNYSTLSESGNLTPYTPLLKMAVDYSRKFPDYNFGTNFGLIYIGERFADLENKIKLNGFIDIRLKVDYKVFDNLTAFVMLENLLNSDIYVWQGYKEKGVYFGLGLNYIF
jgi:hypothetical protein